MICLNEIQFEILFDFGRFREWAGKATILIR